MSATKIYVVPLAPFAYLDASCQGHGAVRSTVPYMILVEYVNIDFSFLSVFDTGGGVSRGLLNALTRDEGMDQLKLCCSDRRLGDKRWTNPNSVPCKPGGWLL
ncbi:hypothetical protein DL95DRAFT_412640 [Leptodontidium sp. 2 PMI_412]|nr:hypothetical protein DL95DRAFT_412640 [Leptodontidium sp. 2 PMI_412]